MFYFWVVKSNKSVWTEKETDQKATRKVSEELNNEQPKHALDIFTKTSVTVLQRLNGALNVLIC